MKKYPSHSQKLAITMGAICEYIFSDQTKLVIKEKIDELEGLEEKVLIYTLRSIRDIKSKTRMSLRQFGRILSLHAVARSTRLFNHLETQLICTCLVR
jgi:hypothetical protein